MVTESIVIVYRQKSKSLISGINRIDPHINVILHLFLQNRPKKKNGGIKINKKVKDKKEKNLFP